MTGLHRPLLLLMIWITIFSNESTTCVVTEIFASSQSNQPFHFCRIFYGSGVLKGSLAMLLGNAILRDVTTATAGIPLMSDGKAALVGVLGGALLYNACYALFIYWAAILTNKGLLIKAKLQVQRRIQPYLNRLGDRFEISQWFCFVAKQHHLLN